MGWSLVPVKVSVVVPVYNPGDHIDGLVASLRRQSLPAQEFEAVFVDDGSSDGTPDRLEQVAAEQPNFRVIRIPRSGWPGKPRNVGLDASRGEYVQFVDHDDELGVEALERMYAYAARNGSDVLVGREVRRNVRRHFPPMFARNIARAEIGVHPLLSYLTPHKMFRRDFLLEHGIRFPEGPRRLEDHPFVLRAYFAADVVSVLADYPCYFWITRQDRGNAGLRPRVWSEWFGHLRDALDVVEANTEPGPLRDRLLSHWFRTKGLNLLGPSLANRPPDEQRALVSALRELTLERYPPSVDAFAPGLMRVAAGLLRAGDLDRLVQLARLQDGMAIQQRLLGVREDGGRLVFTVEVRVAYADGTPLLLAAQGDELRWRPPDGAPAGLAGETDFAACRRSGNVSLVLRHRSTHEMLLLPSSLEGWEPDADGTVGLGGVCTAALDPETVSFGRPLGPGPWDLDLQLSQCGVGLRAALSAETGTPGPPGPALQGRRLVAPYVTANGALAVDVDQQMVPLLTTAAPVVAGATWNRAGRTVELALPLADVAVGSAPVPATLRMIRASGSGVVQRPASIAADAAGRAVLRSRLTLPGAGTEAVPAGQWRVSVRVGRRLKHLPVRLRVHRLGSASLTGPDGERVVSRAPARDAGLAAISTVRRVASRSRRLLAGVRRSGR